MKITASTTPTDPADIQIESTFLYDTLFYAALFIAAIVTLLVKIYTPIEIFGEQYFARILGIYVLCKIAALYSLKQVSNIDTKITLLGISVLLIPLVAPLAA